MYVHICLTFYMCARGCVWFLPRMTHTCDAKGGARGEDAWGRGCARQHVVSAQSPERAAPRKRVPAGPVQRPDSVFLPSGPERSVILLCVLTCCSLIIKEVARFPYAIDQLCLLFCVMSADVFLHLFLMGCCLLLILGGCCILCVTSICLC